MVITYGRFSPLLVEAQQTMIKQRQNSIRRMESQCPLSAETAQVIIPCA